MKVKLTDVIENIFAGGDVPKDRFSETVTDEYKIPVYANAEKDNGLYGYTDMARVSVPCVTVAARGTIGFTAKRIEPFLPVVRLITVIPDKEKITLDYLYYALCNCRRKSSGTSIPQLTVPDIKNYSFEIVPISRQKEITRILDKIGLLMEMQRKQIGSYDTLIKSRFVEMFGDPIHNEKGWKISTVKDVCAEIYGGGTPSKSHPEYYEDGNIPWVSSKDMKTDVLYDSQIHINQLGVDNSTARMVPTNSVIMVIRSGILKHTLPVAINVVPITVNQDLKVFIPNKDVLPRFLAVQFKMIEKEILSGVRAVTADNIEFDSLKRREIIVPPIKSQQRFLDFAEQVDKLKVAQQKRLEQTQILFDSLMQQYFG